MKHMFQRFGCFPALKLGQISLHRQKSDNTPGLGLLFQHRMMNVTIPGVPASGLPPDTPVSLITQGIATLPK